jgi:hypothetical protein
MESEWGSGSGRCKGKKYCEGDVIMRAVKYFTVFQFNRLPDVGRYDVPNVAKIKSEENFSCAEKTFRCGKTFFCQSSE